MLSFLYTTDLHGREGHYEALLSAAQRIGVPFVHLGADLLPKGRGNLMQMQQGFVENGLKAFHSACRMSGIRVLSFFGNDDVYALKKAYRAYAPLLDESPERINEYEFRAYGFVPDYPFPLKTACKIDHPGWERPWVARSVDTDDKGNIVEIKDPEAYFASKGTIQNDLRGVKGHRNMVMATHTPPNGYGLDVVPDNDIVSRSTRHVGSSAVREWIEEEQPLLVLSGHIHESPRVSGMWRANIGSTVVLQPGQDEDRLVVVLVELDGETVRVERNTVQV